MGGDDWEGITPLSEEISQSSNGQYSITPDNDGYISSDSPDYQYSIWFQTPPVDPSSIERLHSLQLVTECHDQGFCDVPSAGNWTWFELAILENEHSETPRLKDGIELTWISHLNRFCQDEYDWKPGMKFTSDHDIFRLLEDGNVVAVRLCTRFQGWELYARSAHLLIEIGESIQRKSLSYGSVASQTKAMQDAFMEINNSLLPNPTTAHMVPDELYTAEMLTSASARPLRVLSLDGGGVRGVAALMLLDAVIKKVAPNKKPCEIFDMIGGTSTGGFIAIMLGRFKMTIDECLTRYTQFMNTVFPVGVGELKKQINQITKGGKYDATILEKVIKGLVKERLGDEDAPLMDTESEKDSCKVFVMATKSVGANNSAPTFLRTYKNPLQLSELPDIKLWQAARATSAAPTYFAPMKVGNINFVDGGAQANNPLGWLWNEVLSVFGPARATSCFLSIGTGIPASMVMSNDVLSIATSMPEIAANSEITNILFRSLINAFAPQGMTKKYWRFNVGDGFPDWIEENGVGVWKLLGERKEENIGKLDDVGAIEQTKRRAEAYLATPAAEKMVAEAAEALKRQLI